MHGMPENSEMIERQRKLIAQLQEAINEQPLYEPGEMAKAMEAQVAVLHALEDRADA